LPTAIPSDIGPKGRVTLLGDSAHAPLQSLAQGAGMAIEDAVYLAALLDVANGDIASAFLQFQQDRVVRTSRVQLESRMLWDLYHTENGIVRDVRRHQYQERTAEDELPVFGLAYTWARAILMVSPRPFAVLLERSSWALKDVDRI
jgi:hypothetical protein